MAMFKYFNEESRLACLSKTLRALPKGACILDTSVVELKNHKYFEHLDYVLQDFCQYHDWEHPDAGLQTKGWDISRMDLVSDITEIPKPEASFDAALCSEVQEHDENTE